MNTKHQVHNLIILDESGSMFSIQNQIIRGFNEIVQTVKGVEEQYPEQEHFISFVTFNGLGITEHLFNAPVKNLLQLEAKTYRPDASTPLYDAIGYGVSKLERILDGSIDYDVLVTILTDGEENSSREYNQEAIKKKIEKLECKRWAFTYTGTDHDVYRSAGSLSIKNVLQFTKNDAGLEEMFLKEKAARFNYSANIRSKKGTDENFYSQDIKGS